MNLRRFGKALIVTSVSWGVGWSLLSLPALYALMRSHEVVLDDGGMLWRWTTEALIPFVGQGMLMGAGFALLLGIAARRVRSFKRLSYGIVGAAGAIAAFGMSAIGSVAGLEVIPGILIGLAGGATSVASLAIARRAPTMRIGAANTTPRIPVV